MNMDYEKEYKAALGRARNLHKDAIDMEDSLRAKMAEIIFPELKESEDEEIRTWLEEHIEAMPDNSVEFKDVKRIDILHWLEKQETSYTGKDVDDAYLKGISDTKNEIERQYEANYQIRKDIATFIFNYRGDIKDRAKWMNYLGIKVSFTEVEQGGMSNKNDERLRKTTICFLKDFAKQGYENAVECIDWLEKLAPNPQGKSALGTIEEEEVDNANKVEPRFKVRDWVVRKDGENFSNGRKTAQITKIDRKLYWFDCGRGLMLKDIRLWDITKDAQDGDVLAVEATEDNQCPFVAIYNYRGLDFFNSYCCIGFDGSFSVGDTGHFILNVHPATKEQRELLFRKVKEAGYEWDADNKQLIKLL